MERRLSRRRVVQTASAGAIASVAGCSALSTSSDDEDDSEPETEETENGDENGTPDRDFSGENAATVGAYIDEEEMREKEAELMPQVQEGEMDPEEADEEMESLYEDLAADSVDEIKDLVAEEEGISLVDSHTESALLLVDGDANAILELLSSDRVDALLESSEFDEIVED